MSRTPAPAPAWWSELSGLPPEPADLNLSDLPTVKGKDGAVCWFRDVLGVPISMNSVIQNTNNRRLASSLLGGAVWYSTRDLWRFVMEQRRSTSSGH
jgi:hypothetical protein